MHRFNDFRQALHDLVSSPSSTYSKPTTTPYTTPSKSTRSVCTKSKRVCLFKSTITPYTKNKTQTQTLSKSTSESIAIDERGTASMSIRFLFRLILRFSGWSLFGNTPDGGSVTRISLFSINASGGVLGLIISLFLLCRLFVRCSGVVMCRGGDESRK
jgi:hypothetical protein